MSNLLTPISEGQKSLIKRLTDSKILNYKNKNILYNSNYGIENFVNVVSDIDNSLDTFKVLTDPTYSGFKLFFHFDATSGLLADETYIDSALAYLKRIGYTEKYELLKRFINVLSKVNSITPWIFQDVEGLQELYTEPFEEIYKEHQLNILCLETVDNKIGSIAQMYKSIAYDHHNRKWILPKNLRQFSMSIFVYDYRVFSDLNASSIEFLQTIENTNITQLNHTLFDLGYCQFDAPSGGAFFESVSNNRSDANLNNLAIKFEQYDISGLFKSLLGNAQIGSKALASMATTNVNNVVTDDSFFSKRNLLSRSGVDIIRTKVNVNDFLDVDKWRTKVEDFGTATASDAIERIRGAVSGLYLGNVYGFGVDDVINAGQTLGQMSDIPSLKHNQRTGGDLGNVYN
ncbi:hypothetical protein HYO65_gp235 [Tenacibaculum phage PTm1]|uniref:Uncharacterized protein n=2 Tax=Shirahamavirus PTm1 TaxID=2846435 RepID=A0A5S9BZ71_9CAUD|nr:hypothetical protein HYO65_gp235 [Tenacibaculum phage PTm1]BBI90627.1 hypothetical protein [Tenacibaculum phage PTm1]BBI90933.1 hypothetical protein [Tenacibaculum phage PTm5]